MRKITTILLIAALALLLLFSLAGCEGGATKVKSDADAAKAIADVSKQVEDTSAQLDSIDKQLS